MTKSSSYDLTAASMEAADWLNDDKPAETTTTKSKSPKRGPAKTVPVKRAPTKKGSTTRDLQKDGDGSVNDDASGNESVDGIMVEDMPDDDDSHTDSLFDNEELGHTTPDKGANDNKTAMTITSDTGSQNKGKKRELLNGGDGTDSRERPSNKRQVTGVAKPPSQHFLQYNTEKYPRYDPMKNNIGNHVTRAHSKPSQYDSYSLFFMDHTITSVNQVPKSGVRLDDMTVAFVSEKLGIGKHLNDKWQSEFDTNGMVRGLRVPLGNAAKQYKRAGDQDLDGNVLKKEDEGWYYMWYRGLHLLCGKEGLDAKIYLKRPAFETIRCAGLGWKKGYRAVIQRPAGYYAEEGSAGVGKGEYLDLTGDTEELFVAQYAGVEAGAGHAEE